MSDVIYIGGGGPAPTSQGGLPGWVKDLIPIGLLAAAAWLLYPYIANALASMTGSGSATQTADTGTSQGTGIGSVLSNLQKSINSPGTYVNAGVSTTPVQGTGIDHLFVNTGPGTPVNLFPLGDVVSTSRDLSTSEQQTVLTNLANQPYLGWWSSPAQNQAVANAANPNSGTNAAGTTQSNIPAGTSHTPCSAADYASGAHGCRSPGTLGANDGGSTWY